MIIYGATKAKFLDDIFSNDIENIVHAEYTKHTGRRVGSSELQSWKNSLQYVNNILVDEDIPTDTGVFVEYHIQQTSKRIDLMLSGTDEKDTRNIVLIELKQWSDAKVTDMDGLVRTRFRGGEEDRPHPSYQAWSYASLLRDFNEVIYSNGIGVHPCAYAHNFGAEGILDDPRYAYHIQRAPLFMKRDALALREFVKRFIRKGDKGKLIYEVEQGRIRPSKVLADMLSSMLAGNDEFVMIDDQKVVFETALALIQKGQESRKQVYIVEGGPGTGKSVVAVNLLVRATADRLTGMYVTKNAAPRAVYEALLSRSMRKSQISNLFKGSGAFQHAQPNSCDVLIVDEAHRMNEKSGLYGNEGINQVMEVIRAARTSVFFLDEDQKVTLKDIGSKEEIVRWAKELGADVHFGELASQFRCNGSDGYLSWLDNALQIRETANLKLAKEEFVFNVFESASALRDYIYALNKERNRARMVAGYCWDWRSKKDSNVRDIEFPGTDFSAQWNLSVDGSLWIMAPKSVEQVGCIHTCQGLEVDHIGVIIGNDLVVRDGHVVTDGRARSWQDNSVRGFKQRYKANATDAQRAVDPIIRNTYRTLMTRGSKSCSVYCTDPETNDYFKGLML